MLGFPNAEVGILVISDQRMRALNRRYRKIDRTTDVLSFPLQNLRPGRRTDGGPKIPVFLIGDIVISGPVVLKQAREEGRTPDQVFLNLLIHGLLHLLGYDHERSPSEAKQMKKKEQEIYKTVNHPLHSLTHSHREKRLCKDS